MVLELNQSTAVWGDENTVVCEGVPESPLILLGQVRKDGFERVACSSVAYDPVTDIPNGH